MYTDWNNKMLLLSMGTARNSGGVFDLSKKVFFSFLILIFYVFYLRFRTSDSDFGLGLTILLICFMLYIVLPGTRLVVCCLPAPGSGCHDQAED